MRIPLTAKKITVHAAAGYTTKLWVHHTFVESNAKELTVNSRLINDNGLVMVEMEQMRFREVRADQDREFSAISLEWSLFLRLSTIL